MYDTVEGRKEAAVQRIAVPDNNPHVREFVASRRGGLAFDIGANIGQTARVLAPNFAAVVSVEPAIEAFAVLADEAAPNVHPLLLACGAMPGDMVLYEAENSLQSGQLVYGPGLEWGPIVGQRKLTTTTLDLLAGVYGLPDFVKIDVEGSEVAVLEGAAGVIEALPAAWLVEVHHASHEHKVRDALRDYTLTKWEHEHLPPGSPVRTNHFYLAAVL